MKYNKLVRDKIPEHIRKKGVSPITHIANGSEYWGKLKEKLLEEVEEFQNSENIEELADILEVIDTIIDYKGFSRDKINMVKKTKLEDKGGFKNKIILDES